MNIQELKPGMHVKDYDDYEFVVQEVHEPSTDKYGVYCQVNTECGNVVHYRPDAWDKFTEIKENE